MVQARALGPAGEGERQRQRELVLRVAGARACEAAPAGSVHARRPGARVRCEHVRTRPCEWERERERELVRRVAGARACVAAPRGSVHARRPRS